MVNIVNTRNIIVKTQIAPMLARVLKKQTVHVVCVLKDLKEIIAKVKLTNVDQILAKTVRRSNIYKACHARG